MCLLVVRGNIINVSQHFGNLCVESKFVNKLNEIGFPLRRLGFAIKLMECFCHIRNTVNSLSVGNFTPNFLHLWAVKVFFRSKSIFNLPITSFSALTTYWVTDLLHGDRSSPRVPCSFTVKQAAGTCRWWGPVTVLLISGFIRVILTCSGRSWKLWNVSLWLMLFQTSFECKDWDASK